MAAKIERVDIWSGPMKDKSGALAEKLGPLADAGANLEFVFARRDKQGAGLVFVTPIKGPKQGKAAKAAGLKKTANMVALCVSGVDKAGTGAKITAALAEAGINLRGLSAIAIAKKYTLYIAVDSAKDATKARQVLAKALK